MRLFAIILMTLAVGVTALLAVRFWGLSKTYTHYESAFFRDSGTAWIIPVDPQQLTAAQVAEVASAASSSRRPFIFFAELRPEIGHRLEVGQFKSVVERTRPHRLILAVQANEPNLDLRVSDLIPAQDEERIMIQSEFDVILRSLKKLRPRLIFGSSRADETRMYLFSELMILPAAPFRGDVLWLPLRSGTGRTLAQDIPEEMRRRRKKFFVGLIENSEELHQSLHLSPDGVAFRSLEMALKLMQSDQHR